MAGGVPPLLLCSSVKFRYYPFHQPAKALGKYKNFIAMAKGAQEDMYPNVQIDTIETDEPCDPELEIVDDNGRVRKYGAGVPLQDILRDLRQRQEILINQTWESANVTEEDNKDFVFEPKTRRDKDQKKKPEEPAKKAAAPAKKKK